MLFTRHRLDIAVATLLLGATLAPVRSRAQQPGVALPATGVVGTPLTFTAPVLPTIAGAAITWSFGDGATGSGGSVQHTYTAAGVFQVAVQLASMPGPPRSVTSSLHIYPAETAILHCLPGPGVPPVGVCRGGISRVDIPAGWNLIADSGGLVLDPDSDLYTIQPGDHDYVALPFWTELQAGVAYWVYFAHPGAVWWAGQPPPAQEQLLTVPVPAGQWVLLGDPFRAPAIVVGADAIEGYNPDRQQYESLPTLQPGQGAWVYVQDGGAVTLTVDVSGVAGGVSAALGQPMLPKLQALRVPGSVSVPPDGVVWLYLPAPSADAANPPFIAVVTNRSNQIATTTEDGARLTIGVPPGFVPLPDLPCTPQADSSVTTCALTASGFVHVDAADATQPEPLPIAVTVQAGESLALSALASDGSSAVAAVGIALAVNADGTGARTVSALWDGSALVLTAPDGYRILDTTVAPLAGQGCTPNDYVPTAVTCAAPGSSPRLFNVATESLGLRGLHPPGTPSGVDAEIVSPAAGGVYLTGQPVVFTARGYSGVPTVDIWDYGDDSAADGQVVQHAYVAPGQYTSTLHQVFDYAGSLGVSSTSVLVTVVPPSPSVR